MDQPRSIQRPNLDSQFLRRPNRLGMFVPARRDRCLDHPTEFFSDQRTIAREKIGCHTQENSAYSILYLLQRRAGRVREREGNLPHVSRSRPAFVRTSSICTSQFHHRFNKSNRGRRIHPSHRDRAALAAQQHNIEDRFPKHLAISIHGRISPPQSHRTAVSSRSLSREPLWRCGAQSFRRRRWQRLGRQHRLRKPYPRKGRFRRRPYMALLALPGPRPARAVSDQRDAVLQPAALVRPLRVESQHDFFAAFITSFRNYLHS